MLLVLAICAVASVVWASTKRSGVKYQQRMEYQPCHFPEIFEKPIFCFLNSPLRNLPNMSIPEGLCRHVVLCCQTSDDSTVTTTAVEEGILLSTHAFHAVRYLGFGGPEMDAYRVNNMLPSGRHNLVSSIISTVKDGEYSGGAAIFVHDWTVLRRPDDWNDLVWDLTTAIEKKSDNYRVVLVLPRSARVVRDLFKPFILMTKKIIPVMPSHLEAGEIGRLSYTTCSSPFRAARPTVYNATSLERVYEDLKTNFLDHWPTMKKSIVFTFSLAWTHFSLPNARNMSAGLTATYRETLPYRSVCRYTLG
ncbi:hypothetical protein IscW_ISCW012944 [Ixodes scapularis]|uniref:Uncharacterized protein n=1 Tax=Ixodes scapularis TaxID=6945 RepID=B7QDD8_IXOSC|nr:hypothetical protein IscW_ISCW012944 [Ixodes scapularis]|eukprot:XP_002413552.1 hypothetical protein IscW_ISCW012944 [Ixodes scapularis]